MRLVVICLGFVISVADPVAAQISCSPISSVVSIGKVSPRPAFKSVMSTIPISCANSGTTAATETILLSIDKTVRVISNGEHKTPIPLNIVFGSNLHESGTEVCRDVSLKPGESRVFDMPITLGMFIKGQHNGHYQAIIPITAQTLVIADVKERCR